MRIRWPDPVGRWCLAGAGFVGLGAATGQSKGAQVGVGIAVLCLGAAQVRRSVVVAVLAGLGFLGCVSGMLAVERIHRTESFDVPEGPVRMSGRLIDDARPQLSGAWFLLEPSGASMAGEWSRWRGPVLLVTSDGPLAGLGAGDEVIVAGVLSASPGQARGDSYAAIVDARSVERVGGPHNPLFWAAAVVRQRVEDALEPWGGSSAAGLVAGFLIGDTSDVATVDEEALRLAGLSHYVAVSGSNVALFLALWWVVVGPLAMGPRRRAVAGVLGVVLFAVVTRWEPSVLRASAMAIIVLAARAVGYPFSAWSGLGVAVGGLLLASPELVFDVGFQLSVAATLGVLAGAGLFGGRLPKPVASTLSATVAAQLAVAPVLLARFGSVPLAAPAANLMAAPAVAFATLVGILGVTLGSTSLVACAVGAARWVLQVADVTAGLPQLGPATAAGVLGAAILWAVTRSRVLGFSLAVVVGWFLFVGMPNQPQGPAVVFLDIGQGDAIVVLGEAGEVLLMDGGPDGPLLIRKLRQYDIDRVDLMVVSHPHEDHLAGLVPVLERHEVGAIWHPGFVAGGDTFENLMVAAGNRGIDVAVPAIGHYQLGTISIEVLGPLRRYAHPNDQSLVLLVGAGDVLLPGDIERIAQRELGPIEAAIMKVPHSGSSTSDLWWLEASQPGVAVISVGPNSFGHPAEEVIAALERAGSRVIRTDQAGDVVIPLAKPPESQP